MTPPLLLLFHAFLTLSFWGNSENLEVGFKPFDFLPLFGDEIVQFDEQISTTRNVTFSIVRWSCFPSSATRTSSQRSTGAKWDENGNQMWLVGKWQPALVFCCKMDRFCWYHRATSQESALQTFALRDLRIGRCWEESDGLSFCKKASFEWHTEMCFVTRWFSLIFHHYLQLSLCVESYFALSNWLFSFLKKSFFQNIFFFFPSILKFCLSNLSKKTACFVVFLLWVPGGKLAHTWGMIAKLKMKHSPRMEAAVDDI